MLYITSPGLTYFITGSLYFYIFLKDFFSNLSEEKGFKELHWLKTTYVRVSHLSNKLDLNKITLSFVLL